MPGRRNSSKDADRIQSISDHAIALGAIAKKLEEIEDYAVKDIQASKAIALHRRSEAVLEKARYLMNEWYEAITATYGYGYVYPHSVYPDYVIICAKHVMFYRADYTIDELTGDIQMQTPMEWTRVGLVWQPIEASDVEVNDASIAFSMKHMQESADLTSQRLHAVKMIDETEMRVGAFGVIWGDEQNHDMSSAKDFFNGDTEFWLDEWDKRPMLYRHAMDPATKNGRLPLVGIWDSIKKTDIGLWFEGQLDSRHQYIKAIKKLIKMGALSLSTDSVNHLVQRRKAAKGTHEVVRWPIVAASLETQPAEPRLLPVESVKRVYEELGIDFNVAADEADASELDALNTERARTELLLLELLTLETL